MFPMLAEWRKSLQDIQRGFRKRDNVNVTASFALLITFHFVRGDPPFFVLDIDILPRSFSQLQLAVPKSVTAT